RRVPWGRLPRSRNSRAWPSLNPHPIDAGLTKNKHPRLACGGAILIIATASSALAASSGLFVLLVVVNFGELGVDDVFFLAVAARCFSAATTAGLLLGGLLIHRFAELIEACASPLVFAVIASASSPFNASFRSAMVFSIARRSASPTLEPCSASAFSVEWTSASAWFLASTCALRFLSSSACASASLTIFWISASDRPPEA